jgi:hypothetical protein
MLKPGQKTNERDPECRGVSVSGALTEALWQSGWKKQSGLASQRSDGNDMDE